MNLNVIYLFKIHEFKTWFQCSYKHCVINLITGIKIKNDEISMRDIR